MTAAAWVALLHAPRLLHLRTWHVHMGGHSVLCVGLLLRALLAQLVLWLWPCMALMTWQGCVRWPGIVLDHGCDLMVVAC